MSDLALQSLLLAMGDDELLLGHRDGEWTGHAPILEEDIAFASISQDEIGHALVWYTLRQELGAENPDSVVYFRDPAGWRHATLVELPKGDWAFTIVRQYLFDAMESIRLAALRGSSYAPLAAAAGKIYMEEMYHLRHSESWLRRLGDATVESHERMQVALTYAWPYALALFEPLPGEGKLVAAGIKPAEAVLAAAWREQVTSVLTAATLAVPESDPLFGGRTGRHSEHLPLLLAEMQKVARAHPGATW